MAKDVVKYIRLFKVIQFVWFANELPCWETPVCQVLKKNIIWHQARYGDNLPSSAWQQHLVQLVEVWNFVCAHGQVTHALHKFVAGAARQQLGLALKQRFPGRVISGAVAAPALVNRPVWAGDLIGFHGA